MKINRVDSFLVELPQKPPIAPYQSRYRAASSTAALLMRIETDRGIVGWGEAPQRYLGEPLSGGESATLRSKLIGRDPREIDALYTEWGLDGGYLQSAVEMACWDIAGKVQQQPLYRLLGDGTRSRIELAACMGIQSYDDAGRIARTYLAQGFTTLKTKAGRDPAEDLAMVRGVRDAVGDQLRLRIDPNTGYNPDDCLQLAKDLEPYRLEYLEQPMPADLIDASARIRQQTSTPLALNESVTTLERVREILDKRAAAVVLPDTYQCGGMLAVVRVAELAAAAGVDCVMHCAHDLGLKTAAMLHLVAATPAFTLANDCTYYGLADDVIAEPFRVVDGHLKVPDGPGLGVDVDLDRVRKYQLAATA